MNILVKKYNSYPFQCHPRTRYVNYATTRRLHGNEINTYIIRTAKDYYRGIHVNMKIQDNTIDFRDSVCTYYWDF